jgi:hypothetical protein
MSRTMRGLVATLVLLLGALAVTGMLASSLQEKATAGHRVDEDFLPGGDTIDRQGWRIEPKAVRGDTDHPDAEHPGASAIKARSRLDPDDNEL